MPTQKQIRIAMDVTPLLRPGTGISRATGALLSAMTKLSGELELVGVGRRLMGPAVTLPVRSVRLRLPRSAEPWIRRLRLIETLCPADLYHATDFYLPLCDPSRAVATVHDLIFLTDPEGTIDHARLRQWAPDFIRRCRAVIAISEFTKHEVMSALGVPQERIHVVYHGIDGALFRPTTGAAKALGFHRPYFLAVSCSTGRKNTPRLLYAYAELAKQKPPRNDLVLAWDPPPEIRAEYAANEHIHFIGRQGDDSLPALYSGATALVLPSFQEGFGFPVLEAMSCGAPVITSNTTSLPEVGGDAATYIEPSDTAGIVEALRAFDDGDVDVAAMRAKGLAQAAKFTWEKCARETLAVYRRCLS